MVQCCGVCLVVVLCVDSSCKYGHVEIVLVCGNRTLNINDDVL